MRRSSNLGARGGPSRQLNILVTEETKVRLEELAIVLQKSQASIVVDAIHDLYDSLDKDRRDDLATLRSLRNKIAHGGQG